MELNISIIRPITERESQEVTQIRNNNHDWQMCVVYICIDSERERKTVRERESRTTVCVYCINKRNKTSLYSLEEEWEKEREPVTETESEWDGGWTMVIRWTMVMDNGQWVMDNGQWAMGKWSFYEDACPFLALRLWNCCLFSLFFYFGFFFLSFYLFLNAIFVFLTVVSFIRFLFGFFAFVCCVCLLLHLVVFTVIYLNPIVVMNAWI